MCDYALYTELAAIRGALKPVGGEISWKTFKEMDMVLLQQSGWICERHTLGEAQGETANKALQGLSKRRFRLLLSSTMAVLAYAGYAGKPCERSFVADIDVMCKATPKTSEFRYPVEEMSEFVTYTDGRSEYTFAFDGQRSLSDKVKKYKNVTDGWAFFDIQRDIYWPCALGESYGRVKQGIRVLRHL
ncbi:uncharacterized protein LOC144180008 [Haemaphysalis longicornis]